MQPGETVSRSPLDKPLHLLTEDDISQVTREDCRRFLKEKGMRRPSWNKAQAIQQVLSLKTLLETVPYSDSTRKLHIPRADIPPNPVPVSITASVKRAGADSQISASVEKSVPYRSTDFRNSNFVADQRRDDNVSVSRRISGTSNEPAAQMTIFYCGKVNVYDDVPRDKAQAILRLAASTLPSFQEASCDVISALCPSPCQVGTPGVKAAENSPTVIFPTLQTGVQKC